MNNDRNQEEEEEETGIIFDQKDLKTRIGQFIYDDDDDDNGQCS